jgi:hypothetical protein
MKIETTSPCFYESFKQKCFSPEGGVFRDRKIALVALFILASIFLLPMLIGRFLSLVGMGLAIWILSEKTPSIDWGKYRERSLALLNIFLNREKPKT